MILSQGMRLVCNTFLANLTCILCIFQIDLEKMRLTRWACNATFCSVSKPKKVESTWNNYATLRDSVRSKTKLCWRKDLNFLFCSCFIRLESRSWQVAPLSIFGFLSYILPSLVCASVQRKASRNRLCSLAIAVYWKYFFLGSATNYIHKFHPFLCYENM